MEHEPACKCFPNVFRKFTYYQMTNLDNRIANADQLLTQDVEKFCDCVAELYSNLSKVSDPIFLRFYLLINLFFFSSPSWTSSFMRLVWPARLERRWEIFSYPVKVSRNYVPMASINRGQSFLTLTSIYRNRAGIIFRDLWFTFHFANSSLQTISKTAKLVFNKRFENLIL